MSGAVVQRSRSLDGVARAVGRSRPLPRGYGLLVAAGVSLALWAGIFWLVARLIG